jgi:glycosyltransferase involved in cell wall biosynthesis
MFNKKKVSVVMPAYNEEKHIKQAVREFISIKYVDEVVVVDNNSKDNTYALAKNAGARVVKEANQGYGFACRRALREATGDLIILVEPDGTFDPKDINKLLAYADDFEMVLGTRTTKELIWKGANMGMFLKWGNWFLGKMIEVLYTGPSLSDVGCTYRLIKREALEKIKNKFTVGKSHFSPEMMILALKNRIRVVEIPVNYKPRRGESKITGRKWPAFKLGLIMIGLILKMRIK